MTHSHKKGFTLLELLIVITILAILTLVVVLFINPVEILKKSRDVQRMSDLDILRTAVNLYLQDSSSNTLGGTTTYTYVQGGTAYPYCTATTPASNTSGVIKTSYTAGTAGAQTFTKDLSGTVSYTYTSTTTVDLANNNSKGWIPYVDFTGVRTGAPVSKLPVDPINTAVTTGAAGYDSLYYRYACKSDNTFELDATLESLTYGPGGSDDKAKNDGGSISMRYEVGTNLRIIPSTAPIL